MSENKRDALTQKHHKQDSNSYILIMYVYTYGSNDKVLQVKYKSRAYTQREGNEQTIVLETAKITSCRIMMQNNHFSERIGLQVLQIIVVERRLQHE